MFSLNCASLIDLAQEMQISLFKLKADDSFIVASGRFNGDFSVAISITAHVMYEPNCTQRR